MEGEVIDSWRVRMIGNYIIDALKRGLSNENVE